MFPRPRKITRLILAAFFATALFLTAVHNMGRSDPSSMDIGYLINDAHKLSGGQPTYPNAAPDMRHLHSALSKSPEGSGLMLGVKGDADIFIRHVRDRLNSAGVRAIREMKSRESRVEVKPPNPSVNPHNFRYIHNPSQICASQPSLLFLIYIHSSPKNLKRRQLIRQTWGNPHLLSLFNASMIFALGAPSASSVQKMIDMEFEEYGDLMQEDYLDSYRNLTYKGMSVLKWANNHCKQPLFFIKTDDDIILDIVSIIDHILTKTVPERGARKLILCNVWTTMKVIRDPKSKWGLSKEEFSHDFFPPYCSGSAFFLSGDMVPLMYQTALNSKFFWVDDYFISGLIVNKLGVKHERFNDAYLLNGQQVEEKIVNGTKKFMVFHIKNYPLFFKSWRLLLNRHKGMSSYIHNFSLLNTSDLQKNFKRISTSSNETSKLNSTITWKSKLKRTSASDFTKSTSTRQNVSRTL